MLRRTVSDLCDLREPKILKKVLPFLDLNKHLRIHVGSNTYFCNFPYCSESFRLIADLKVHESVHIKSWNPQNDAK